MAKIYWNNLEDEIVQAIKNPTVQGVVKKINDKTPDNDGLIEITASDLGAITSQELATALADVLKKTDIIDDLTTGGSQKVLSAEQGKVLKNMIETLNISGVVKNVNGKTPNAQGRVDIYATDIDTYNTSILDATFDGYNEDILNLQNDKVNKTDIADNLTTVEKGKVLDASQGKILKDMIAAGGTFTEEYRLKLEGIETGANKYILPTAKTDVLGGVKPDGTTIKITADGVISTEVADLTGYVKTVNTTLIPDAQGNIVLTIADLDGYTKNEVDTKIDAIKYTLPKASATVLGGVMIGDGISIDADGKISVPQATTDVIEEKLPTVLSADYPIGHSVFISTNNTPVSKAWLAIVNEPEVPTTRFLVETFKTSSATAYQKFTLLKAGGLTPFSYERTSEGSSWSVATPVGTYAKRNATPPDIPPISPVYGSEKVTLFTINGALQFNDQWIESMGLTLTDANRAIIETYKETDSAGIASVTQFAKVFLNTTFKGEYVRFMNASQDWGMWTKTISDPESIEKPQAGFFTTTTVANGTKPNGDNKFYYEPNVSLKDGDKITVVYNTTTLPQHNFTVIEINGKKVIELTVDESNDITKNEVYGEIKRGFADLS